MLVHSQADVEQQCVDGAAKWGWRCVSRETRDQPWREADAGGYLIAVDNGDRGKVATCACMATRKDAEGVDLVAVLWNRGELGETVTVIPLLHEHEEALQMMGVRIVPSGTTVVTACGKGYDECANGEPPSISLKQAGVEYFKYEGPSSLFYWVESGEVRRIWLSD